MDPRTIISFGIMGAVIVRDTYVNRHNKKLIKEQRELLMQARQIMIDDQKQIDYLLQLMNKYQIPVDEFERIVLKSLDIASEEN